jgi:hypothetical protein
MRGTWSRPSPPGTTENLRGVAGTTLFVVSRHAVDDLPSFDSRVPLPCAYGGFYTVPFALAFPLVTAWRRRREHCKNPNAAGQAVWVDALQWGSVGMTARD